jgi:hypothetical protein
LQEEAGYSVTLEDLVFLGTIRSSKSSDTINFLFTVDLTDRIRTEADGDGTDLEEYGTCHWASNVHDSDGPLPYVMKMRMEKEGVLQ